MLKWFVYIIHASMNSKVASLKKESQSTVYITSHPRCQCECKHSAVPWTVDFTDGGKGGVWLAEAMPV